MPPKAAADTGHDYGSVFLTEPPGRPQPGKAQQKKGGLTTNLRGMLFLILVPWCLYCLLLLPFFRFYHHHFMASWGCVFAGFLVSATAILIGVQRKTTWYVFLGLLCVFACVSATIAGYYMYHYFMFPYYSYETLLEYTNVLPSEPTRSMQDAGKLVFSYDSRVDVTRSVGYKASSWYCAAPILDEESGIRVEYWAVGVDCCSARADFGCDSAWDWRAKSGLVVLRSSEYLPSNIDYYRKAVKEAEAAYGFVSSDEALLVRWVDDPVYFQESFHTKGVSFALGTSLIYFFVSVLLGALLQVLSRKAK